MKYIEDTNLARFGRFNFILFVLVIILSIAMWLTGCRAGYVTETPINIMAEIPSLKIARPLSGKLEKKPKQKKQDYEMQEYKRIFTFKRYDFRKKKTD